jgi:catechol 2,3-dioxygenase-like lactoylglutathione lyase family enzyme
MNDRMVRLLKDVEEGRIGRRELLRALGLGVAGAFAAGAVAKSQTAAGAGQAAAPPPPRKAFPVTTMNHVRYEGTDYAKARDWYVDLFGMRIAWDNGRQCALEFGDLTRPEGFYIRNVAAGAKPDIDHFGFGTPNIMPNLAAMKVELERWKVTGIQPDGEHGWSSDSPSGFPLNPFVSDLKDHAMFPGAAPLCVDAESEKCKAGYEAGLKNLDKLPKPSGKGFKATQFSHVVLYVPADKLTLEKEFHRDLLGMKVIYEAPDQVIFRYGKNAHILRTLPAGRTEPFCNNYGFQIENFDRAKVEAELKRRGLNPRPYSPLAWTISDPDGMQVEVAGPGLAEHLAKNSGRP